MADASGDVEPSGYDVFQVQSSGTLRLSEAEIQSPGSEGSIVIQMLFTGHLCTLAPRMREALVERRRARIALALMLLALAASCSRPPAGRNNSTVKPFSEARRDLSQDEAAGGHTLRKHVGRTDAELRKRLDHERDISAASTWNDRSSAETAIGTAIADQNTKISRWLERDRHPNLVLDYDGDSTHPFGRTLRRGEDRVESCAHATIVLRWDGANAYHVLTAYPECRS